MQFNGFNGFNGFNCMFAAKSSKEGPRNTVVLRASLDAEGKAFPISLR